MENKGFITFAFGKKKYIEMAVAMAKSARHHGCKLPIAVVCDKRHKVLDEVFDVLIDMDSQYGRGVSQKIHIDCYTPFEETIFVDSDCIFFKSPDLLWERYKEAEGFGVEAYGYVSRGEHYYSLKDVDAFLDYFNVQGFSTFNTGLFYFDRSEKAKIVFEKARDVYAVHHELPLKEFKNSPVNDEPLFAMATEIAGTKILDWNDTMGMVWTENEGLEKIDVLNGFGKYTKDGQLIDPILIHFNINTQDCYVYLRELRKLKYLGSFLGNKRSCLEAFLLSFLRRVYAAIRQFVLLKIVFVAWEWYRKVFPNKDTGFRRKLELIFKKVFLRG